MIQRCPTTYLEEQVSLKGSRLETMPFCFLLLLLLLSSSESAYAPQKPDWVEAEMTRLTFPSQPSPDLSAQQVAMGCLRSLQLVDVPTEAQGIDRIFPYFTWQCRSAVTMTRKNVETLEAFRPRALVSPVLQVFMGATSIQLGEATLSPATNTRGDIVSFGVYVRGAEVHAFQHKSGMIRDRVGMGPPEFEMVIRLERQRRPPDRNYWLVREIADTRFAMGGQGWSRHEGV